MKLDKKKSILQKNPKQKKITIKTMMIKIKIKNKLEGNYKFFIEWWNKKKTLIKG